MIELSEIRIRKQVSLLNNLNLNCYLFEFTLTETSAGGALLYVVMTQIFIKRMNWNLLLLKLST